MRKDNTTPTNFKKVFTAILERLIWLLIPFLLSRDVSPWLDLVMVYLREGAASSQFLKRLIKIDLCGTLDRCLETRSNLDGAMPSCKCTVAPWKIIGWFPRVVENLNGIEESLASVFEGDAPNKDLLPKLVKN